MPINLKEAEEIAAIINPIFDQVVKDYDFSKYPADNYKEFKRSFAKLAADNMCIELALKWKWGYWKKDNYPGKQKQFVAEVQRLWPRYIAQNTSPSAECTFSWWSRAFNRRTAYISATYITHLIHHAEMWPIIDQHNYRAMGALKAQVRSSHRQKKKPSDWGDMVWLKQFMESLLPLVPNRSFGELDRFLMMYGKNHASR